MEVQMQYEKYRASLKKQCIMQIVAEGVALVAIIFLLFLPNFSINLLSDAVMSAHGTTLPKLAALEEFTPTLDFSV